MTHIILEHDQQHCQRGSTRPVGLDLANPKLARLLKNVGAELDGRGAALVALIFKLRASQRRRER